MKTRKPFLAALLTLLCVMLLGTTAFAASGTVATIGSTKYTSLESAIKKVKTGQTIVLKKNVNYTQPLVINRSGKTFTINLNKKTITFKNANSFLSVKKGNVTLKNGTIKQAKTQAYVLKTEKNGKLTVESGTYSGLVSNLGTMTINKASFANIDKTVNLSCATIDNKGTMTINKGAVVDGKKMQAVSNSGTLTINGGVFRTSIPFGEGLKDPSIPEQQTDTLLYNYNKGKLTINGGKFTSPVLCLVNEPDATVTVNKGTASFTSNLVGCFTNYGTAKVKGGTWTSKEGGWGVFYNFFGTMTLSNVTVKSAWSVLETYGKTTAKVTSGTFTSSCDSSGPAMFIAFGNSRISVNAGTVTGKKFWGAWQEEESSVKFANAVKLNVKEVRKTGELFWNSEEAA